MIPVLLALSAHAATVHHCLGQVAAGERIVQVQGYGLDEAAARRNSEQAGRQVAARLVSWDAWAELLTGQDEALGPLFDRATVGLPLAVPGATWKPGECTVQDQGEAPGWQATIQETTVQRAEPALAASAVRRLACEQAWAEPLARTFVSLAKVAPDERDPLLRQGLDEARAALAACHALPVVLSPAQGDAEAPVDGVVECLSYGPQLHRGPQGRGWGGSLDAAADAAAWERAAASALAPLADGLEAMAHASEETKTRLLASAAGRSWTPLGDDLVERGLTSCRVLPPGGDLAWIPEGDELPDCAEQEEWPDFRRNAGGDPSRTRAALCTARAAESVAMVDEAVQASSELVRPTMRATGWSLVVGCDAGCRAHTRLEGSASPARLARVPAHATQQAAAELLMAAVQARDVSMAALVLPSLLAREGLQALEADPDRIWTRLEGLAYQVKAGKLPPRARWVTVGADVVLDQDQGSGL